MVKERGWLKPVEIDYDGPDKKGEILDAELIDEEKEMRELGSRMFELQNELNAAFGEIGNHIREIGREVSELTSDLAQLKFPDSAPSTASYLKGIIERFEKFDFDALASSFDDLSAELAEKESLKDRFSSQTDGLHALGDLEIDLMDIDDGFRDIMSHFKDGVYGQENVEVASRILDWLDRFEEKYDNYRQDVVNARELKKKQGRLYVELFKLKGVKEKVKDKYFGEFYDIEGELIDDKEPETVHAAEEGKVEEVVNEGGDASREGREVVGIDQKEVATKVIQLEGELLEQRRELGKVADRIRGGITDIEAGLRRIKMKKKAAAKISPLRDGFTSILKENPGIEDLESTEFSDIVRKVVAHIDTDRFKDFADDLAEGSVYGATNMDSGLWIQDGIKVITSEANRLHELIARITDLKKEREQLVQDLRDAGADVDTLIKERRAWLAAAEMVADLFDPEEQEDNSEEAESMNEVSDEDEDESQNEGDGSEEDSEEVSVEENESVGEDSSKVEVEEEEDEEKREEEDESGNEDDNESGESTEDGEGEIDEDHQEDEEGEEEVDVGGHEDEGETEPDTSSKEGEDDDGEAQVESEDGEPKESSDDEKDKEDLKAAGILAGAAAVGSSAKKKVGEAVEGVKGAKRRAAETKKDLERAKKLAEKKIKEASEGDDKKAKALRAAIKAKNVTKAGVKKTYHAGAGTVGTLGRGTTGVPTRFLVGSARLLGRGALRAVEYLTLGLVKPKAKVPTKGKSRRKKK